jgi:hypothetical protein
VEWANGPGTTVIGPYTLGQPILPLQSTSKQMHVEPTCSFCYALNSFRNLYDQESAARPFRVLDTPLRGPGLVQDVCPRRWAERRTA